MKRGFRDSGGGGGNNKKNEDVVTNSASKKSTMIVNNKNNNVEHQARETTIEISKEPINIDDFPSFDVVFGTNKTPTSIPLSNPSFATLNDKAKSALHWIKGLVWRSLEVWEFTPTPSC